jgi:hypothetical protein
MQTTRPPKPLIPAVILKRCCQKKFAKKYKTCFKPPYFVNLLKFRVSTYSVDKAARRAMLSSQVHVTSRKMVVEFL